MSKTSYLHHAAGNSDWRGLRPALQSQEQLHAWTPAAGVIWEGGRRRSSDVIKYLIELADVMPAVWIEATQKTVKEWKDRITAMGIMTATGWQGALLAALKITSAVSNI